MKLINHFFSKQFILFLIVGCINTFNGVIFAALFNLFLTPSFAFIVGYICSLIVSFLLNSRFVFKHPVTLSKFPKFVVSYIPNFIIQLICVMLFINWLSILPIISYTIAAIIGVPVTFLVMKLFAFKQKEEAQS